MKASLIFYHKDFIANRYVVELVIYEVMDIKSYPDKIKYGLICKDLTTGAFVLMDNHFPKGPHVHINQHEATYVYINNDRLIEDFKKLVWEELGVKL